MWRLLALVLFATPALANEIQMCPSDLRQYTDTYFCASPDSCRFDGIRVGLQNDSTSSAGPTDVFGVNVENIIYGTEAPLSRSMIGVRVSQQNQGTAGSFGDTSTGFVSLFSGPAAGSGVYHFLARTTGISGTPSEEIGFVCDVSSTNAITFYSIHPTASMQHAGPARFGATGAPTTGYDMDVEGPLLVAGGYKQGQATSTPGATPTATAATPTATVLTPTPTPTKTAEGLLNGGVVIDGDLTLGGLSARTLKVGECQLAPCSGKGLTITGGAAKGSGVGGGVTIQGGNGAALGNVGGNVSLLAPGSGGGNVVLTPAYGFANTLGKSYVDGNIISRLASGGSAPTVGTCGTSPSVVGTNTAGRITIGTGGTVSACTLTFGNGGFTNAPTCTVTYDTVPDGTLRAQTSTTTMIVTNYVTAVATAYTASAVLNYHCIGRE